MRLQEQVEHIPGVTSAAITNALPLTPSKSLTRFAVQGAPPPAAGNFPVTQVRSGQPVVLPHARHRACSRTNVSSRRMSTTRSARSSSTRLSRGVTSPTAIPSAASFMMNVLTPKPNAVPVIGVVGNAKDLGVDTETEPVVYTAGYPNGQILLVRTSLDPLTVVPVRPANRLVARPQPRRLRREDHGRSSLGLAGAAAAVVAAARLLRLSVRGTGGDRRLWRAGVCRHANARARLECAWRWARSALR